MTTSPITLVSQANDAVYSLLEKTKFEHIKLPVDVNTLNFENKGLDLKYREFMLCNSQDRSGFSPELLNHLIFFYFVLTTYYILTLTIVLTAYFSGDIRQGQMLVQLILLTGLVVLFYCVLVLAKKRRKWLLNIRSLLTPLICLLILYLSFTDKASMEAIFGSSQRLLFSTHTLPILLFLQVSLFVTLYHFPSVLTLSTVSILSELTIKVTLHSFSSLLILEEIFILVIFALIICFTAYIRDTRSKKIFYQLQKEEQAHKIMQKTYAAHQIETGIKTEVEKAADICDSVRKTIKEASAVIIYNDIRGKLKEVLNKIDDLRNKIVRGVFVEQAELEFKQEDPENEKFIRQMYLDKTLISRKNTLLSMKTLNDIPLSPGLPTQGESEVNSALLSIGRAWNFNIWPVFEQCGHSASLVGSYIFTKWEFSTHYGLNERKMNACFRKIETEYRNNPFHNACHAADVCHSLLYFINHSDIIRNISGMDLLSSLLAALGHDIGHPGLTNRYLVITQDDLAVTYNDTSILENMHAARLFSILKEEDSNLLQDIPVDDVRIIRKLIIEMILETDMSKHFASVGRFRSISKKPGINYSKQEDKFFCLAFALKCADAGYSAKSIEIHVEWTQRAVEELFLQGDLEREKGLEISAYCDRSSMDVPNSQETFLNVICKPMYETWTDFLKSEEICYNCKEQLLKNLDYWKSRCKGRRSATPDLAKTPKIHRFFSMSEKRQEE